MLCWKDEWGGVEECGGSASLVRPHIPGFSFLILVLHLVRRGLAFWQHFLGRWTTHIPQPAGSDVAGFSFLSFISPLLIPGLFSWHPVLMSLAVSSRPGQLLGVGRSIGMGGGPCSLCILMVT